MTVHVASPAGYELPTRVCEQVARVAANGASLALFTNPREAVRGADAVYTDVWTSMGQEDETAERRARSGLPGERRADGAAEPDAHLHALPAGAPRRGSVGVGRRAPGVGGVRSGREPAARAEGAAGDVVRVALARAPPRSRHNAGQFPVSCPALTIHGVPNWSMSMPKPFAQKVG